MSEYTAEDFAKATFARREDGGKAVRFDVATDRLPWQIAKYGATNDEGMAADGWVPVVEATEAHPDQVERLSKRLAAAGEQIERQRLVLDDLRDENDRLERILQAPLSLKDLEVAWEAADEYATSNREQAHGVTSVLMFMHHRADRIEKEGR